MITNKRLKEITQELYKIVKILCNNNDKDMNKYISKYTNLTDEEREILFMNKRSDL